MIYSDFYNLSQFRQDGRKPEQMRSLALQTGLSSDSVLLQTVRGAYQGSSHLRMGLTEVLCLVKGPMSQASSQAAEGVLHFRFLQPAFSGMHRKANGRVSKEMNDFAECLRSTFEKALLLEHYQKTRIEVNLSILQQDGSVKAALINAVSLALAEAGIEMRDSLVAVQVGFDGQNPLADLTYKEERDSQGVLTLSYLPHLQQIDFLELSNGKVSLAVYEQMQQLALHTCESLYQQMSLSLKESALKKLLFCQE